MKILMMLGLVATSGTHAELDAPRFPRCVAKDSRGVRYRAPGRTAGEACQEALDLCRVKSKVPGTCRIRR